MLLFMYSKQIKHYFVRATIDVDSDGDISKEEFMTNALKSSFISDVLKEKERSSRRSKCIN